MRKTHTAPILGMFPGLGLYGGIPASGLLAWEKLAAAYQPPLQPSLFCYSQLQEDKPAPGVYATSRMEATLAALRNSWPARTILVWHIGLLKLVPFLRIPRARVILFLHGIEIWKYRGRLDRMLLRQVDLFLTNSDFTWEQFVAAHPAYASTPHRTVHLGIGQTEDEWISEPSTTPIALMIGRLDKQEDYKGHRELIGAWPEVILKNPRAELWIMGDGDLRAELERVVADLHMRDRIKFWGRVSEEKKQEMLSQCRCLALPSRGEGFGLVYLEAMRLGRPCLVSTLDAGREVVNPPEAGLAVDPARRAEVANAIHELLTPGPQWEAWAARARQRYEQRFQARQFQDRLLAALQD